MYCLYKLYYLFIYFRCASHCNPVSHTHPNANTPLHLHILIYTQTPYAPAPFPLTHRYPGIDKLCKLNFHAFLTISCNLDYEIRAKACESYFKQIYIIYNYYIYIIFNLISPVTYLYIYIYINLDVNDMYII